MTEQKISLDLSDLFIQSNEKIGELRDDKIQHINEISIFINQIFNQTQKESKIKKDCCEICNFTSSDSSLFELHHVSGCKHDFRMITSCKPCHRILSDWQKLRDYRWWISNQSENIRKAFFLHGLYDILCLKSRKTGNSVYEEYTSKFIEQISILLRGKSQ